MTSVRWATLGAVALLAAAPFAILASCGSSKSSGEGDQGDATADGATLDGARDGTQGDGGGSGDGAGGDGQSPDGTSGCSNTCPSSVQCGHYTTCTGAVIACGSPCPKNQVCVGSGSSQTCEPTTTICTGKCGVVGTDSCGVAISCGGCPTGQQCVNNLCQAETASDAGTPDSGCTPLDCNPNQNVNLCGTLSDGCGNTKQCSCPSGQQCYGGLCGTTPPECTPPDAGVDGGPGAKCGSMTNACGSGDVQCGNCSGATKCENNTCTGCTAPSCGPTTCGSVSNGCGPAVSCGTCGTNEDCYDGGCCTPLTCAQAQDAGLVQGCGPVELGCGQQKSCTSCGTGESCYNSVCCTPLDCAGAADAGLVTGCDPVDLGCGQQKSCAPCSNGQVCQNNACTACVPLTCAHYNDAGCNHPDQCGNLLDCCASGTLCQEGACCPPGQTNQGGLCCPTGDVNYQGTCCQPACNNNLPPGPQISCGLTIYCGGIQ
jgi:hypothetical protein